MPCVRGSPALQMPRLRRGGATCTLVCLTLGPELWPVTSTYFRGRGQRSLWQEWEGGSPRLPGLLGPQGQKGQVGLPGATCQHIYWAFSVGWCEGLHSADTCQAVSFDTELVNLDGTFSLRQAAFSAPVLRRVPPEPQHVHLELQGDVPAYHVQPAGHGCAVHTAQRAQHHADPEPAGRRGPRLGAHVPAGS